VEARCRYGRIEIGRPPGPARAPAPVDVPGPGLYAVPAHGTVEVGALRAADVPWPLALRARRPGDRFRPDGGRGTKKLKAWLIDRKVPREDRDRLLVLASGGRVLAIPELGAVAAGLGPSGAGLAVRVLPEGGMGGPDCKRGAGLL
jgi:tRNA(Ile)-lysidine synthase